MQCYSVSSALITAPDNLILQNIVRSLKIRRQSSADILFQIISLGFCFRVFQVNSDLFLAAADSVLSAAFLSNDGDDSA